MLTPRDIEFFGVLAQSESLAAAARTLDVSVSAVSQRLQQLEARLGVSLAVRSSRRLALTEEGQLLAQRGQVIADDLASLAEDIAHRRSVVAGHLRVVAPLGFGRRYIAPAASAFCAEHPDLTLDLSLSDRLGRTPEGTWDVAVHIGVLHDSSLVVQRLAPNDRVLCASPDFIERHGAPAAPDDLQRFDCIALRENDEDVTLWRFTNPDGDAVSVRIEPRMASNDGDIVREWAIEGHGIIARSEWSVADDLRDGRLVRLLPDYTLPSADIVMLVGMRHGRSARTTAFLQHLRKVLQPVPWRIGGSMTSASL